MTFYPMVAQRGQRKLARWVDVIFLALLLVVVIGLGVRGVPLGWGYDLDSRAIFEASVPAILQGSYVPGRSYGNPLYEYVAAGLYAAGGISLANIYSLILAIGSIFIFGDLLNQADPLRRLLALIGFTLSPIFLLNSSKAAEWMQTYFFILCLLWSAYRWVNNPRICYLYLYGLFSSLLVLTQPDAAFVCVCVCFAMMWQRRFEMIEILQLTGASVIAGAATLAIFVLINGGIEFLRNIAWDPNTWSRSFIIAIVGICNLFGFAGAAVLAGCTAWLLIRLRRGVEWELTFWGCLYLVGLLVGSFRFIVLPSKLEYIFPLIILALLMIAYERIRLVWSGLFSISIILPSLFTISVFQREVGSDGLFVSLHLDSSAIIQDWTMAKANALVMRPDFLEKMAEQLYADEPGPPPRLYTVNWGPGLLSDRGDLIIGESEVYRLDSSRFARQTSSYQRRLYRRIYICDKSVFHGSGGWRNMEQPAQSLSVDPVTGRINVQCHREGDPGSK